MAGTRGTGDRSKTLRRRCSWTVIAMLALGACQADAPTTPQLPNAASLAKGGPNADVPTVTAADPASTVQDTTIDVNVFGTGFTAGAKATWSLSGDTTQVHVTLTTVVSSGHLVARIVVPATAPISTYDIQVTLSNGKKGVGAEMFEVQSRRPVESPSATWKIPLAHDGLALRSDGLFSDGTNSVYATGVCSVSGTIFVGEAETGDAILQMSYPKGKSCGRRVTMVYPDGFQERLATFSNLNKLQSFTLGNAISVGQSAYRRLIVGFGATLLNNPNTGRCGRVIFGDNGVVGAGTDMLVVTRINATTWRVQSQPAPNNRAFCETLNVIYENMNVDFTIESSYALPG